MFPIFLWIICGFATDGSSQYTDHGMNIIQRPRFYSRLLCRSYTGLNKNQQMFCRSHPGVVFSAMMGVRWSIQECTHQFKEERWNCSNLIGSLLRQEFPFRHKFLRKSYRETAAALALISAGIFTEISKSCINGELPSCNFRKELMSLNGTRKNPHNHLASLSYAGWMTKRFLKSKAKPRDVTWIIKQHNLNVGRKIVRDNFKEQCHCHGFSGSCEVKTCWFVTSPFREVAQQIKQKYDLAVRVNPADVKVETQIRKCRQKKLLDSSHDKLQQRDRFFVPGNEINQTRCRRLQVKTMLPKNELVYSEDSPNFCLPNSDLDLPGTQGRLCNATNNNCKNVCCDRGFKVEWRTKKVRCRCKFKWCCEVICDTCYVQRKLGICN